MALTIVQPTADTLRLVTCYEDGRLAVLDSVYSQKEASQIRPAEGQDWRLVWYDKGHKEPSMLIPPSTVSSYSPPKYLTNN